MEKITYGVPRLVDWVAQIKVGAATVRVHFTGGALTAYGVTPAEYSTANPFIQKVIEQSSYFKEGRIIILRSIQIQSETPNIKKTVKDEPKAKLQSEVEMPVVERAGSEMTAPDVNKDSVIDNSISAVEVTCLQDAQAYLQEHYNIPSYKVRSYELAQHVALEHGVRFTGANFDTLNNSDNTDTSESED